MYKSNFDLILTKSLALTEAPLSHNSLTLEEQPAMTAERKWHRHDGRLTKQIRNGAVILIPWSYPIQSTQHSNSLPDDKVWTVVLACPAIQWAFHYSQFALALMSLCSPQHCETEEKGQQDKGGGMNCYSPASCRAVRPCRSTFPTGQLCCNT